mmetsp:Transcript_63139/g.87225  ORF Transcript_63139/g.87225 Transcript_63139/m.87225 type:complete len:220 (-) Transcript_63139:959-1618(-)
MPEALPQGPCCQAGPGRGHSWVTEGTRGLSPQAKDRPGTELYRAMTILRMAAIHTPHILLNVCLTPCAHVQHKHVERICGCHYGARVEEHVVRAVAPNAVIACRQVDVVPKHRPDQFSQADSHLEQGEDVSQVGRAIHLQGEQVAQRAESCEAAAGQRARHDEALDRQVGDNAGKARVEHSAEGQQANMDGQERQVLRQQRQPAAHGGVEGEDDGRERR